MALRNAAEVYDRLRGMHDSDPRKQKFKAELAGHFQCVVYDADGKPRTVRAENIEHYIGKGFTVTAPVTEAPAEPEKPKRRKKPADETAGETTPPADETAGETTPPADETAGGDGGAA